MTTTAATGDGRGKGSSIFGVGLTAFSGTALEWYDFYVYATAAALVFPALFFPTENPVVSTIAAFGTLAVGYVTRPIGSIVFGHLGDRVGRKNALVATMILMGLATIGIGLLPTYGSVGVVAPALLIVLRMTQSIAYGGEYGGATLIAYEHAPVHRRCVFASLPQTGLPAGAVMASGVWLVVTQLPEEQLLAWGWRVPFLLSVVLVVVGLIVRLRIPESPEFQQVKKRRDETRLPLFATVRHHWRQMLLVGGAFIGFGSLATVTATYLVRYATTHVGVSRSAMLTAVLITTATQLVFLPLGGYLGDRFGVRPIVLVGAIGAAVAVFVQCALVDTGQFGWLVAGYVLCFGALGSIAYGPFSALFAAAFATQMRYTGMSLGYQVSNTLGSGMAPMVATALVFATGSVMTVAAYVSVLLLISAVCLALLTRQASVTARSDDSPAETAGTAQLDAVPHPQDNPSDSVSRI